MGFVNFINSIAYISGLFIAGLYFATGLLFVSARVARSFGYFGDGKKESTLRQLLRGFL